MNTAFWGLNSFWKLKGFEHVVAHGRIVRQPVLTIVGSESKPKRFVPTPAFSIPKEPA